jgi:hypothetical protein
MFTPKPFGGGTLARFASRRLRAWLGARRVAVGVESLAFHDSVIGVPQHPARTAVGERRRDKISHPPSVIEHLAPNPAAPIGTSTSRGRRVEVDHDRQELG